MISIKLAIQKVVIQYEIEPFKSTAKLTVHQIIITRGVKGPDKFAPEKMY